MKLPGTAFEMDARLEPLLVPISSLIPDAANPRRTKRLAHLVELFSRFGYTDPVVANAATNLLEAGHQRLAALRLAGATHVPVVYVGHTGLEAAAYNIAHNRANEVVAEWDDDALRRLLSVLQAEDDDLVTRLGFDTQELERRLGEYSAEETGFPSLGGPTRSDLSLRTFTLSRAQLAMVEAAVTGAKESGAMWNPDENNTNLNGNAIAEICRRFVEEVLDGNG